MTPPGAGIGAILGAILIFIILCAGLNSLNLPTNSPEWLSLFRCESAIGAVTLSATALIIIRERKR